MNVLEDLESAVLAHYDEFEVPKSLNVDFDNVLQILASVLTPETLNSTTIFDLRDEDGDYFFGDETQISWAAKILSKFLDVKKLSESSRNLLKPDTPDKYKLGLARILAEYGSPMEFDPGYYYWASFVKMGDKPVAILEVYEDEWDEFVSTFEESSHKTGLSGQAVWADGTQSMLRWETDLSDLILKVANM